MAFLNNWFVRAGSMGAASANTKMGNLMVGGQLGIGPKYTLLDAATPAIFNPATAIVIHTPTMWDNIAGGNILKFMLKSAIETHGRAITGVDFSYSNEAQNSPVGHDGQEAKVPSQTRRSAVNPSITFQEVVGNPIWNIGRRWMFDMNHPDTTMSLMSAQLGITDLKTQEAREASSGAIPPFLYSSFSMSMLLIQFDPTGLPENIMDAAFYTNMFPTEIGELGIERTHNTSKIMERNWNMTALVQHNNAIRDIAVKVADLIRAHEVDYNYATPDFTPNDTLITSAGDRFGSGTGYGGIRHEITKMLDNYLPENALKGNESNPEWFKPIDNVNTNTNTNTAPAGGIGTV